MIEFWLADENIFFTVAIILMFMIGILQLVGLTDFAPDFGASADADADIDGANIDSSGHGLLSLLGFGRLPVLMLLVLFLAIFGLTGLVGQQVYHGLFGGFLPGLLAASGAAAIALPLTGLLSRPLSRIIPQDETTAINVEMLTGRRGTIQIGTARIGSAARAKVIDIYGQEHFVMVEPATDGESFSQGEEILLVRREAGIFKAIGPNKIAFLE